MLPARGADFRDGAGVRAIEVDGATTRGTSQRRLLRQRAVLIGADGVNGIDVRIARA